MSLVIDILKVMSLVIDTEILKVMSIVVDTEILKVMSLVVDFDNTKRSRDDFANFRIERYKMNIELTFENFCLENFSIYNSIDYTQCL